MCGNMKWVKSGFMCLLLLLLLPGRGLASDGSEPLAYVYFVVANTLRALPDADGARAVQASTFRRGDLVVWRAEVFDTATGEPVGKRGRVPEEIRAVGLRLKVRLGNGLELPMQYGVRPSFQEGAPPVRVGYWSASWRIPKDHPTGLLRWSVMATDDVGLSSQFQPIDAGIVVR